MGLGNDQQVPRGERGNVKESQKLFIPMAPYHLYPLTLAMWDVMLVPLRNMDFNAAKSDIKLVDAGAKGIPFIASDVPVYRDWPHGGKTISNDDLWYETIELFIKDKATYDNCVQLGKREAKKRDMIELHDLWRDVIENAIEENE